MFSFSVPGEGLMACAFDDEGQEAEAGVAVAKAGAGREIGLRVVQGEEVEDCVLLSSTCEWWWYRG